MAKAFGTDQPDTWDYRWTFCCLINGGLTALPNRNLVRNVGFGKDATHTTGRSINTMVGFGIDPNKHPTFVLRDGAADRYSFDHNFGGNWQRFPLSLLHLPKKFAAITYRVLKRLFLSFLH